MVFMVVLQLFLPFSAWAQLKDEAKNNKQPIEVFSDRMRSESKGDKIIFSGNVVATWGEMEIKSDILEVYKSKAKEDGGADQVIAIGNVKLKKGDRRAQGDKAVYLDKAQQVILTGSPHATAWEGDNIIEGKEMIFILEEDRFLVNNRVRMKLFPKKKPPEDDDRS